MVFVFIAALLFATATIASAKTAQQTFMKFIEAEDCTLDGYTIVDGNSGAVGKMITGTEADTQSFTVTFDAPADGQYVIWLKVWHTSQSDNSLKYTLDDGVERVFDFDEDAGVENPDYFMFNHWYWMAINERGTEPLANGWSAWGEANSSCRHTPVYIDAKAGTNSVTFTCREAGHFIDQVIITDDLTYNPADVPGNETYVCTFCNLEHFKYEPFEKFGKTPEQYWTEKLAAEQVPAETAAPETDAAATVTAADTAAVTAPATLDVFIYALALPAAAVLALAIKKRVR